jgi:hypothetical protein
MALLSEDIPRHMRLFELMRQQELLAQACTQKPMVREAQPQWDAIKTQAVQSLQR